MSNNIVEIIQQKLGFPPIQKVDPNIQEIKEKREASPEEKLAQAAIPAVLAGLYRFADSERGANYILTGGGSESWLESIFKEKKTAAVEKVAQYAGVSPDEAEATMEEVADEAVLSVHQEMGDVHTAEKLKTYLSSQRHGILVYLPAAMQMGDLIDDNSLDDRTNKMEGPISNLMHKIENAMSKNDDANDLTKSGRK